MANYFCNLTLFINTWPAAGTRTTHFVDQCIISVLQSTTTFWTGRHLFLKSIYSYDNQWRKNCVVFTKQQLQVLGMYLLLSAINEISSSHCDFLIQSQVPFLGSELCEKSWTNEKKKGKLPEEAIRENKMCMMIICGLLNSLKKYFVFCGFYPTPTRTTDKKEYWKLKH